MKIYFIIGDEPIFHPWYVARVVQGIHRREWSDVKVVGITVLPPATKKDGLARYLKKQWEFFGPSAFFRFAAEHAWNIFLGRITVFAPFLRPRTLVAVATHFKIPYVEYQRVNDRQHLEYLKVLAPDVIISSSGQLFKAELLALPTIACINRHSSLLPKYGGVWPIFWAMLHGEREVGASIHLMADRFDNGDVISQRAIPITSKDTFRSLYGKAYATSADVTLEALSKLREDSELAKSVVVKYSSDLASYYSFPTKEDAKRFRRSSTFF